jgi:hypothetical protein
MSVPSQGHYVLSVYIPLEKIPTNIFMSFSSKLHVEHNQRGVGGQFLRPISQELCEQFPQFFSMNELG